MQTLLQIVQAGIAALGAKPATESETMELNILLSFAALRDMAVAEYGNNDGDEPDPVKVSASIAAAQALQLWHWSNTAHMRSEIEPFAEEFYPND